MTPTFAGSVLVALGAALGALVTLWGTAAREVAKDARRRRDYAIAIYLEIRINLEGLQELRESCTEELCRKLAADAGAAVHAPYGRNTRFFLRARIETLGLGGRVVAPMVAFYSELENVYVQLDALQSSSFRKISGEGRAQVIRELREDSTNALHYGFLALHRMSTELPMDWLRHVADDPRLQPALDASGLR